MTGTITRAECEAALCLWEAMLEAKDGEQPWQKRLNAEWLRNGTSVMRLKAIDMASGCDEAWNCDLSPDDRDSQCFDWDFVPAWLAAQY